MFIRPLNTTAGNLLCRSVVTIHHFLLPIAVAAALLIPSVDAAAQQMSTKSSTKGSDKAMLIQKDYDALTGRWQLVQSIIDGKPVPEAEVKETVLITDHDELHLPANADVGTAPLGTFKTDPPTMRKQDASAALSGP